MAGAAVCFYIARILGRDVAEKLTSISRQHGLPHAAAAAKAAALAV